jgi:hypothetical protein
MEQLSPEIFSSLLTEVGPGKPDSARPGVEEKRSAQRLAVDARVGLAICGGVQANTRTRQVAIKCVSRTGVAVLDDVVMRVGERFLLQIPRAQRGPLWIHCTVANTRLTSDGRFRIGARFSTPAGHSSPVVAGGEETGGGGFGARLRKWFAA